MSSGHKYLRDIPTDENGLSDVYDVLEAFEVTCPARAHAVKKLLCTGLRGKADAMQDLTETQDALARAVRLEERRQCLKD